MSCYSIGIADIKVRFLAGVNLHKNPSNAGDLYFYRQQIPWHVAQCQWSELTNNGEESKKKACGLSKIAVKCGLYLF